MQTYGDTLTLYTSLLFQYETIHKTLRQKKADLGTTIVTVCHGVIEDMKRHYPAVGNLPLSIMTDASLAGRPYNYVAELYTKRQAHIENQKTLAKLLSLYGDRQSLMQKLSAAGHRKDRAEEKIQVCTDQISLLECEVKSLQGRGRSLAKLVDGLDDEAGRKKLAALEEFSPSKLLREPLWLFRRAKLAIYRHKGGADLYADKSRILENRDTIAELDKARAGHSAELAQTITPEYLLLKHDACELKRVESLDYSDPALRTLFISHFVYSLKELSISRMLIKLYPHTLWETAAASIGTLAVHYDALDKQDANLSAHIETLRGAHDRLLKFLGHKPYRRDTEHALFDKEKFVSENEVYIKNIRRQIDDLPSNKVAARKADGDSSSSSADGGSWWLFDYGNGQAMRPSAQISVPTVADAPVLNAATFPGGGFGGDDGGWTGGGFGGDGGFGDCGGGDCGGGGDGGGGGDIYIDTDCAKPMAHWHPMRAVGDQHFRI